jgi:hypothetical protein
MIAYSRETGATIEASWSMRPQTIRQGLSAGPTLA